MDAFDFDFHTNSLVTDDTNSDNSNLDWAAFQLTTWSSQQDDAVAPDDRLDLTTTRQDNEIYFQIEHFFNGLNHQQEQPQLQSHQEIIEPVHVNIHIPDQTRNDMNHVELPHQVHIINERPPIYLPAPLIPRISSSRSQCYHKLPDHAVKLMQEWYNAHLDDPYPRSSEKKRFITEGNITAQQCRSWFANRRQRLKHVKRSQPRASSSTRLHRSMTQILPVEEQAKIHEYCYYCQQQSIASSLSFPLSPITTTLNVVINQQTIEQLIHNSLRKLFNPAIM